VARQPRFVVPGELEIVTLAGHSYSYSPMPAHESSEAEGMEGKVVGRARESGEAEGRSKESRLGRSGGPR